METEKYDTDQGEINTVFNVINLVLFAFCFYSSFTSCFLFLLLICTERGDTCFSRERFRMCRKIPRNIATVFVPGILQWIFIIESRVHPKRDDVVQPYDEENDS